MKQDTAHLLGIKAAALAIAYDNGMINRFQTETEFLEDVDEVIGADGVDLADLIKIDAYLLSLSEKQMDDLCCGGEGEEPQEAVLEGFQIITGLDREMLNGLLNDIFEA